MRITEKMIEQKVNVLNSITNSPETTYTKDDNGNLKANIGNFHLGIESGFYNINRVTNEGGGIIVEVSGQNKRELFNKLVSYINGLRLGLELEI